MQEKIKTLADFLKIETTEIQVETWRRNCFSTPADGRGHAGGIIVVYYHHWIYHGNVL